MQYLRSKILFDLGNNCSIIHNNWHWWIQLQIKSCNFYRQTNYTLLHFTGLVMVLRTSEASKVIVSVVKCPSNSKSKHSTIYRSIFPFLWTLDELSIETVGKTLIYGKFGLTDRRAKVQSIQTLYNYSAHKVARSYIL